MMREVPPNESSNRNREASSGGMLLSLACTSSNCAKTRTAKNEKGMDVQSQYCPLSLSR